MSEYIKQLPPVSLEKRKGRVKKVTLDLERGDVMHVTFTVGKRVVLKVEATPGNLSIHREIDRGFSHEINFYTKTIV